MVSIEWMHGNVKSSDVTMLGTEPGKAGGAILNLTYAPREGTLADGKLASKTDIPVAVTVKIGNVNVTQYVTFRHNDCSGKTCTVPSGYQFLLHVTTGQLTVQSSGGNAGEPYVFTVFKDGERYTEVTIVGNGNVTLYELPAGVYTIQADEDWNWRSTASEGAAVTLGTTPSQTQGTISCLYAVNFTTWLNGFAAMVREIFGVVAGN